MALLGQRDGGREVSRTAQRRGGRHEDHRLLRMQLTQRGGDLDCREHVGPAVVVFGDGGRTLGQPAEGRDDHHLHGVLRADTAELAFRSPLGAPREEGHVGSQVDHEAQLAERLGGVAEFGLEVGAGGDRDVVELRLVVAHQGQRVGADARDDLVEDPAHRCMVRIYGEDRARMEERAAQVADLKGFRRALDVGARTLLIEIDVHSKLPEGREDISECVRRSTRRSPRGRA